MHTLTIYRKVTLTILFSLIAFLLLGTNISLAQDSDDTSERPEGPPPFVKPLRPTSIPTRAQADVKVEERKAEMEEKRDSVQAEREVKREERKIELTEKRKGRIMAYGEKMVERFNAAIGRLEKLAERIDSRIEKMEEKGVDLSESKALLEEAQTSIRTAKGSLDDAIGLIRTALDSDDPKTVFEEVRTILSSTKDSIKAAHQKLVEVIKSIKASPSTDNEDDGADNEPEEN